MFDFHPKVAVFVLSRVARFKFETSFFIKKVDQSGKINLIVVFFERKLSLGVSFFILLKTNEMFFVQML